MDLRPSDEQAQLVDAFAALLGKESTSQRVRDAEPLGFDPDLWAMLGEMGVPAMAVAEADGGWGASMLDLELAAEVVGANLASAPVIETQVAARTLARLGPAGADLLAAVLAGERMVTMCPRRCSGPVAAMVPAGAVATDVLVFDGDRLLSVAIGQGRVVPENLGSMPVADIEIHEPTVLATGDEARVAFESGLDDWLVLLAGAMVGMTRRSLEIGVDYVREREAFGQKIGAFQAIGHRLADCKAAYDGAELLARQAAWAHVEEPDRYAELAAMAFAFASETARDTSYWSLHFHGGYGFMLEYDIQLYYRRSRAWANVVMDSRRAYRRVTDRRYGPAPTTAANPGATSTRGVAR